MIRIFPESLIFRVYGDDFVVLHKKHLEIDTQLWQLDSSLSDTDISFEHQHINLKLEGINSVNELDSWLLNL